MIQGTFADGTFRLRRIDPVAHVLARELSGAWNGESTCRRQVTSSHAICGLPIYPLYFQVDCRSHSTSAFFGSKRLMYLSGTKNRKAEGW